MDKERILEEAKLVMKKVIDDLNFAQIPQVKSTIMTYLLFLKELEDLPVVSLEAIDIPITEEAIEQETEKTIEPVQMAYLFERKTKGGWVPSLQAFVPERVVRELSLEHGDLVYAKKIADVGDGPPRYEFQVAEHREELQPKDRVQINYALVKWDNMLKRFFIDETVSEGTIRDKDGAPMTILINETEASELKLKAGDIVDVAYNINQPSVMRCIWRYSVEPSIEAQKTPSTKKKLDKVQKDYPQTLINKTVLMVGFEPGKTSMEEEVTRRGGELIWSSGKEGHDRMFTMVNKSDCVINMLGYMSHGGSYNAVDIAKTLGIPHGRVHGFGRNAFIQEVYRCLEIESDE